MNDNEENYNLEIVKGVAGKCIVLNDYRISGPKPWGGGKIEATFKVSLDDIKRAIPDAFPLKDDSSLNHLRLMKESLEEMLEHFQNFHAGSVPLGLRGMIERAKNVLAKGD